MINGLRPYPAYNDSWVEGTPSHWAAARLKYLATVVMGQSPSSEDCSSHPIGMPFLQGCAEFGADYPRANQYCSVPAKMSPRGAVLVSVRAPVGRINVADKLYGIGRGLCAVVPIPQRTETGYLRYALGVSIERLLQLATGSTYDAVSVGDVAGLPMIAPPLAEQRAIARFLDHAARRIRRYIRAKERLIELLEERKRALIHEAVTGRIDVRTGQPYPAYKDSGVEWLGKVPEHWELRRNVWLFRERNETGFGSLPVLEVSLRDGVRIRDMDDGQRKQQIVDRSQYKRAREGDIAYNTMRMWQGAVGVVPVDGLVSPAYVVADPVECTESRYYGYLFRTRAYQHAVKSFSRGIVSDRDRLYWDDFKRLASLVPPPHEATTIVGFLDHAVRCIRAAISAAQRQIALLKEYRTRLIADVVTGKLDVREAAVRLPETDPLAGDWDRADTIAIESNLHSTESHIAREASA